jgi:Met-zincin
MKKKLKVNLILCGALLLALASCTKEVPFEATNPDKKVQNYSKSMISEDDEYLFSSSQQSSSMSSVDAFPYFAGDNKRVKVKITEKTLQIIETERDQRYASNPHNNKLVLEIPIEHTQFECAKDKFGECTNVEADNDKVAWNLKPNMTLKFENLKSGQLEFLPIIENQSFGDNNYTELSASLISSSVEKDAINFKIRRTFKADLNSVGDVESLTEATTASAISADYQFSLVKVSSVLSKDYKKISYPIGSKDEQSFGFFSTAKTKLDVDGNTSDKTKIQIMNRWNPNREEITYYLSDEFSKPENKMVNDLTVKTVKNLNEGLQEAGVKFRINLKQPEGKNPGDIRNSMIVLVEDPVASSVIGYGPQTEDPVTGEIISARTIMFLGTIKAFVKHTYDDIIQAKREAVIAAKSQPASADKKAVPRLTLASNLEAKMNRKIQTGKTFGVNLAIDRSNKAKADASAKLAASKLEASKKGQTTGSDNLTNSSSSVKIAKIKNDLKVYSQRKNDLYSGSTDVKQDLKKKFKFLNEVKNCAFHSNAADGLSTGISKKLMDQFADDAKPWTELSDSEKQAVIDIILPEVWIPTLIHEMGHNLGLRHNFQGSEDKDNFYSSDELAARNIDHVIPFSSVMEYGDDLKALTVLGKYDIAALRFGYNREVDVVDKAGVTSTVKLASTLNDLKLAEETELKPYGFCTDEHTGTNAGCKRFDLGTSYTAIVQNMINDYENAYAKRNFRNGRASMSLWDDFAYANRIGMIFEDLRIMLEVKERIKYRYQLPEGAPEWEQIEFLKDLNDASTLAGQHLAKVIATPDVLCAVSERANPNQIIAIVPMKELSPDAMSCAQVQLNPKYMVIAQAGKMFNSMKDPESTNSYADQIDIRGYWIDKVQATNALLKRQTPLYKYDRPTPTFDKNNDSFLNQPGVGEPVLGLIEAIMQDNVVDNVEFTIIDGSKASLQIPYELSKSQVIDKHMFAPVARILGIDQNAPTKLQKVLSSVLAAEAKDLTGANASDEALKANISVYKYSLLSSVKDLPGSLKLQLGQDLFIANPDNTIAFNMMDNLTVAKTIEAIKLEDGSLDQEKVVAILQAKMQNVQPAADITPEEQAVWNLSSDKIEAYLNNVIKASSYYTDMIRELPTIQ